VQVFLLVEEPPDFGSSFSLTFCSHQYQWFERAALLRGLVTVQQSLYGVNTVFATGVLPEDAALPRFPQFPLVGRHRWHSTKAPLLYRSCTECDG